MTTMDDVPPSRLEIQDEKTAIETLARSPPSELNAETGNTVAPRPRLLIWVLVCAGLYLGALLYGLDTTIAADVQASVYQDLGHIEKLPWVGVGFPLGSVATLLLIGKLFATFEIKWLIIGFVTMFEIGSAICGAAPTSNALVVGRVIAGVGGAGMYLGALTYISVFTTLRERTIYNALIGLSWGTGAILGPIIGGGFATSKATWRWAFYINLPLAAATAPIYFFLFPRFNPQPNESGLHKLARLDWTGAVLNACTFVFFIISLAFSGSTWAWGSGPSIATWVIFGISFVSYVVQQVFSIFTTPERRLFPVQFTRSRTMLLMYIVTATPATALSVTLYYVPIFFQFTKGDSALKAAVRLLPFIVLFVFSVMFSGALLPISGRYAPWYFPASILMTIGGIMMYRVTPATSTAAIYGFEILIAVGTGLLFQVGYSVAAAKVAPHEVASSIGFINVAQIGTTAMMLAVAGSMYQNLGHTYLREALRQYNFPEAELRSALAGALSPIISSKGPVIRQLAIDAVVRTITKLYILVFSAGAVTLIAAFCMRWEKLALDPAAAA